MALPPGVSSADFTAALRRFEQTVGAEWVFTSDEDIALYRDAYSPLRGEEDEIVVSAAVAPDSVEQVQAIMRIANELRIPIYPISTGRNLAYGGSAPVLSGSVVLDLKRMNRILEVNERNAYVLVEPGVSYFDLYRHIQAHGLKLWIDTPDPGWGSLIGNALDHGIGYTVSPYRDHFDAHCGMEVVLANGELVRTGMGALPNAKSWQHFKYGFGPYLDGIFSQSNFGVITKMGFWLYPQPEAYLTGSVAVPRQQDVVPLIDATAYLMQAGIMNSSTQLASPVQMASQRDPELALLLERDDAAAVQALNDFAARQGIPYWTSRLKFYGPAKVIAAQWEHAKERFAVIDDVQFTDGELMRFPLTDAQLAQIDDKQDIGVPDLSVFGVLSRSPQNPNPTWGHVGFSPVIPMTGEAILESQRVLTRAVRELDARGLFIVLPASYHARTLVILVLMPISNDPDTNRKNRAVFRKLVTLAAEHGWGEYRTAPIYMDDCAAVYSFNDHALRHLHETIKDAIDPNGIISAGRYGIWPKHLRKTQA